MNRQQTLAWLESLQASFTTMLRLPLDLQQGRYLAPLQDYAPELCSRIVEREGRSPQQRLAVYHRQYWFRFFSSFHSVYPLLAHVMGLASFNRLIETYLLTHPSRSSDLNACASDFAPFVASLNAADPMWGHLAQDWKCCQQAAVIDHAFACCALGEGQRKIGEKAQLEQEQVELQLEATATWCVIADHWNLMALRQEITSQNREAIQTRPAQGATKWWLLSANTSGQRVEPIVDLHAKLLLALQQIPLAQALAQVEESCPSPQQATLANEVQNWLAQSVRAGFWRGMGETPKSG